MKTVSGKAEADAYTVGDLRHRSYRISLRYLRDPDAASHCASGASRVDGRDAGISGFPDVGWAAFLHSRFCRWHRRRVRRVSHGHVWTPPGSDLQHPPLCGVGVFVRIFHIDRNALLFCGASSSSAFALNSSLPLHGLRNFSTIPRAASGLSATRRRFPRPAAFL